MSHERPDNIGTGYPQAESAQDAWPALGHESIELSVVRYTPGETNSEEIAAHSQSHATNTNLQDQTLTHPDYDDEPASENRPAQSDTSGTTPPVTAPDQQEPDAPPIGGPDVTSHGNAGEPQKSAPLYNPPSSCPELSALRCFQSGSRDAYPHFQHHTKAAYGGGRSTFGLLL